MLTRRKLLLVENNTEHVFPPAGEQHAAHFSGNLKMIINLADQIAFALNELSRHERKHCSKVGTLRALFVTRALCDEGIRLHPAVSFPFSIQSRVRWIENI